MCDTCLCDVSNHSTLRIDGNMAYVWCIIVLRNPALVASCNGIKTIIDCILDPTLSDVANSHVLTLLYILDHPSNRKYLRESLDVRKLIAAFVEPKPKKIPPNEKEETYVRKEEVAQRVLFFVKI